MVTDAGFTDFDLSHVASDLGIAHPDALFDAFDRGAVRAAALLSGQQQDRRDAIRADLAARVRADGRGHGQGYLVPAPSVVVCATGL